ncbi:type IV pilus modification protein PilV [Stenotrophomonas sp. 24(2023)]|uniref:type IV pilus modification protein PilV n=1 Tax=Stenotrophomonas sp. 24(2023) TaxID=3068324 RepID=UPI0027DF1218|nr:type IV pilus modification protein PilV [Stenotrophomonas sp. 24(2023)]WMJ70942.1 type IV pilus modification protein PilV [Stenotrophomonas sp. 24(2023)]
MTSRREQRAGARRTQAGSSLIEVLVAVLLLAVGGLSAAMAHASALRRTQGAMYSTTAVHATASLAEAMRANRAAMHDGKYDTAGDVCAGSTPPGAEDLARQDLRRWVEALSAGMGPQSSVCGSVSCQGGICQVAVHWDDSRAAGGEGPARSRLVLGVAP